MAVTPQTLVRRVILDSLLLGYKQKGNAAGDVWDSEMMLNSGALVSGYNDMLGGVMVNNPYNAAGIWLDSIAFRIADPAGVVGGSGGITIQYYLGSATNAEITLLTTVTALTQHDIISVLATPVQCSHNSVLRAKITLGSAVVSGPCHVQFRGRYQ